MGDRNGIVADRIESPRGSSFLVYTNTPVKIKISIDPTHRNPTIGPQYIDSIHPCSLSLSFLKLAEHYTSQLQDISPQSLDVWFLPSTSEMSSESLDFLDEIDENCGNISWLEGMLERHQETHNDDISPQKKKDLARICRILSASIEDYNKKVFWEQLTPNQDNIEWLEKTLQQKRDLLPSSSSDRRTTLEDNCRYLQIYIDLYKSSHPDYGQRQPDTRIAEIDMGIEHTPLSHTFDLTRFEKRVAKVLKWTEDKEEREEYMAPYLVVIQSSGMGNTKLLYEYMKKTKLEKETDPAVVAVKLLLCVVLGDARRRVHSRREGSDGPESSLKRVSHTFWRRDATQRSSSSGCQAPACSYLVTM
jgi:hypothetical protein